MNDDRVCGTGGPRKWGRISGGRASGQCTGSRDGDTRGTDVGNGTDDKRNRTDGRYRRPRYLLRSGQASGIRRHRQESRSYRGYRFPPEIISHAVWLYHRFCLSYRDVEDLLAQRGITVSYEAIRLWCLKFGPEYARALKRRQGRLGDTWHLDEVFVTIQGQRQYLWRAVDQDGDVLDILVQRRRDTRAAKRFFRKLLKGQGSPPWRLAEKLWCGTPDGDAFRRP